MTRPVIALLTDFGIQDHYVGAMKGVMLGICPDATFVDISHAIAPHDILGGALELAACYRSFPAGTVFLVVIDPGVGTGRRPLAVASADRLFVAPDNGVLTAVLEESPPSRVVVLAERRSARRVISRTFEGRDRFAPAAAWLASGLDIGALGPLVTDEVRLAIPRPVVESGAIAGEVLRVDRFGNLVTSIDRCAWASAAGAGTPKIQAGHAVVSGVVDAYADLAVGEVGAIFGSSDHLELAAREGSAADALGLRRGDRVVIRWGPQETGSDGL
jgi:S-adenosyl-L-methionine hydrolase (adenosine-forming)